MELEQCTHQGQLSQLCAVHGLAQDPAGLAKGLRVCQTHPRQQVSSEQFCAGGQPAGAALSSDKLMHKHSTERAQSCGADLARDSAVLTAWELVLTLVVPAACKQAQHLSIVLGVAHSC